MANARGTISNGEDTSSGIPELSRLLLEGWTMLADSCPRVGCNVPLMRSRQGRVYCCQCRADVVLQSDAPGQQTGQPQANGIEPGHQLDGTLNGDESGNGSTSDSHSGIDISEANGEIAKPDETTGHDRGGHEGLAQGHAQAAQGIESRMVIPSSRPLSLSPSRSMGVPVVPVPVSVPSMSVSVPGATSTAVVADARHSTQLATTNATPAGVPATTGTSSRAATATEANANATNNRSPPRSGRPRHHHRIHGPLRPPLLTSSAGNAAAPDDSNAATTPAVPLPRPAHGYVGIDVFEELQLAELAAAQNLQIMRLNLPNTADVQTRKCILECMTESARTIEAVNNSMRARIHLG